MKGSPDSAVATLDLLPCRLPGPRGIADDREGVVLDENAGLGRALVPWRRAFSRNYAQ